VKEKKMHECGENVIFTDRIGERVSVEKEFVRTHWKTMDMILLNSDCGEINSELLLSSDLQRNINCHRTDISSVCEDLDSVLRVLHVAHFMNDRKLYDDAIAIVIQHIKRNICAKP